MPEQGTPTRTDNPLLPNEVDAAMKIKWAHEAPHPDGGTQPIFGLLRATVPVSGGQEYLQLDKNAQPERVTHFDSPSIIGGPDFSDEYSRLVFANLRLHKPINVYLESPEVAIHPLSPEKINEIGNFVVEVDRAFMQDRQSRLIVESQEKLLNVYREYVASGILDETDEAVKRVIEDASVHLNLLKETRKELPEKIRGLLPKAEQLGILLINENRTTSSDIVQLDPEVIRTTYTPDTDNMGLVEFREHQHKLFRNMKPLRIVPRTEAKQAA